MQPDLTPVYNLRAVVRETGLTAETLRAWERRYGLPKPQRTPGGHRMYSWQDIQTLKWLVERQQAGLSISRAVELWYRQSQPDQNLPSPLTVGTASETSFFSTMEHLRQQWLEACLKFDEPAAEQALTQAFALASPETVIEEVLQKGLVAVGQGWYERRVTVQQEHFASALAMRRLHTLLAAAPPPTRPTRILAACPPGEEHEFALLLSVYLLRRRGWDVVYLGINVPLLRLESTVQAAAAGLVISQAQTLPGVRQLAAMAGLLQSFPVGFAYGGGAFLSQPSLRAHLAGHYLGDEIVGIPQAVESLLAHLPPVPQPTLVSPEYERALAGFIVKRIHIEAAVNARLAGSGLPPAILDQAHRSFGQHLEAALALGDLSVIGEAIGWAGGLIQNSGIAREVLQGYLRAYQAAVAEHMQTDGQVITRWLELVQ